MSDGSKVRWRVLSAEGKKVVLHGKDSTWTVFECETPAEAEHKVRELKAWAKSSHESHEYNLLCRAGD